MFSKASLPVIAALLSLTSVAAPIAAEAQSRFPGGASIATFAPTPIPVQSTPRNPSNGGEDNTIANRGDDCEGGEMRVSYDVDLDGELIPQTLVRECFIIN